MNRDDCTTDLLGLLALWWRYESQQLPVLGYPRECPSTAGYKTSRQYDDGNGAAETDERGMLAKAVGHAVDSIEEPYRTALYIAARNRVTGVSDWISPRLPVDQDERAWIVSEALDRLAAIV
jgi:hypothetical protein